MGRTNDFFIKGKLSVAMDGGAGSSGKGKIGAFLVANADNCHFVCNTFMPNASHTIVEGDDNNRKEYVYKNLNSCAHIHHKIQKMYIGQGSVIHLPSLMKEIKESGLPKHKLGISGLAVVVQEIDAAYERGEMDLEGNVYEDKGDGTIKTGTTASGSGAARARKMLRKKNIVLARDVDELRDYICDVPREIMDRLEKGQSGLLEIAQGFQLSYGLPEFYPYTTSRNCTVAAGFDDMMVSPKYLGNVLLNFRTFPIRIHSFKYIATGGGEPIKTESVAGLDDETIKKKIAMYKEGRPDHSVELVVDPNTEDPNPRIEVRPPFLPEGTHLTWDQVQQGNIPHEVIESYSGEFYSDQTEITWDDVTQSSGSPKQLMETTTLTKLPRRVATFSKQNLVDSVLFNQTNHKVYISLNFVNYVDWDMYKKRDVISEKMVRWLEENISPAITMSQGDNIKLKYLGTSEYTDDTIILE